MVCIDASSLCIPGVILFWQVADITFNVWYRLSEELFKLNDESVVALFCPYVHQLILGLSKHCQLEEDTPPVSPLFCPLSHLSHCCSLSALFCLPPFPSLSLPLPWCFVVPLLICLTAAPLVLCSVSLPSHLSCCCSLSALFCLPSFPSLLFGSLFSPFPSLSLLLPLLSPFPSPHCCYTRRPLCLKRMTSQSSGIMLWSSLGM